jgi:hypothetical protein
MNLVIDTQDRICLYNNKQRRKVAKLELEEISKRYKINYFNKIMYSFSQSKFIKFYFFRLHYFYL